MFTGMNGSALDVKTVLLHYENTKILIMSSPTFLRVQNSPLKPSWTGTTTNTQGRDLFNRSKSLSKKRCHS